MYYPPLTSLRDADRDLVSFRVRFFDGVGPHFDKHFI